MLTAGTRIGAFEIVDALGAGGMGEVYRARDTKLRRDVAIKILPELFASDADRVARFQREAETLAALNHPNIAAVYGVEESAGAAAIVLEFVDGETLADVIAHGSLALDDALAIARQIVDALEAAHDRGIVHRDLKPANVKLTSDGKVKVLDFGLAKFAAAERGATTNATVTAMTLSPTLGVHATSAGMILGTAAYMSPEQARGKPVDRRTDIWSFGCVLYEMVTGKQTFGGETVSDAVAATLRGDVDWTALPPTMPSAAVRLLRRCLEKDPQKRLPHVGVARLEIDEALAAGPQPLVGVGPPPGASWRRTALVAVAATLAAAVAAIAAWTIKPAPAPLVTRFAVHLPEGQEFSNIGRQVVAMSPDGTEFVYTANQRLFLRALNEIEARSIQGSETSGAVINPVFSPDGRAIAYFASSDLTLKRIPITGGAPVTICAAASPFGVSWAGDDVFAGQGTAGIIRVPAAGGKPQVVAAVGSGEIAYGPQLLPDGKTLLFTVAKAGTGAERWDKANIVAQSLDTGARTTLVEGGSDARYLATGHLMYALGGTVYAAPFDVGARRLRGAPAPVIEGVRRSIPTPALQLSVSTNGTIVYVPGPSQLAGQFDLATFDRTGNARPMKLKPGPYETPRFSPDGTRVAFDTDDGKDAAIWIHELSGAVSIRRLTVEGRNRAPVWSPDGQRLIFQSDRDGDVALFWQRADGAGSAERLTTPAKSLPLVPESVSPDGNHLLFSAGSGGTVTLWVYTFATRSAAPFGNVKSSAPTAAEFSPDGRWIAYVSNDNPDRSFRIYVQPFPATGAKYEIGSGIHPFWSRDGSELFYSSGVVNQLAAVKLQTREGFSFANPVKLRRPTADPGPGAPRPVDVARDGMFIGVFDPAAANASTAASTWSMNVVVNWFEELKQRVPPVR